MNEMLKYLLTLEAESSGSGGGGGGSVTVDDALSGTSENPVQNKVVKAALDNKVDKVSGKGLSTNDYTTAEKNKLKDVAEGAQVNVIESIKKNGVAISPVEKAVDISVPTKTSDITNDSGFITAADIPAGVQPSTTTPKMAGTAAVGSETKYAKGDHVHPHDTTKVDKVEGKGLSSNDYTDAEKNKLSGIEAGAQKNPATYAASQSAAGPADKAVSIPFGHVDSTSTATAFTATVDGISELRDGVCVWLRNGVVTSATGFTININGLGAKPVYGSLAAATRATSQFNFNYTMLFIYNSSRVSRGCWDAVYGYDSNTTYSSMSQTEANAGTATSARSISAKVLHTTIKTMVDNAIAAITDGDEVSY